MTDTAIGIDLGTTYSCVGVWMNDKVEIVSNDQGLNTTPSYVAFTADERLIGDAAKNQTARNPTNTVFDAKRLIGRKYSEKSVQDDIKLWPFKVESGADEKPMIVVQYKGETKKFQAEQISSMVLQKMKEIQDTVKALRKQMEDIDKKDREENMKSSRKDNDEEEDDEPGEQSHAVLIKQRESGLQILTEKDEPKQVAAKGSANSTAQMNSTAHKNATVAAE